MRLQDLAIVTNTPIDTDLVLLEKFRAHDKIQHDPKTDLYSYKVSSYLCLTNPLQLERYSVARICIPQQSCTANRDTTANTERWRNLSTSVEGVMEGSTTSHRGT